MPQPPPSQRFRPAQRCLLSPLSLVPSGMALSPTRGLWGCLETGCLGSSFVPPVSVG